MKEHPIIFSGPMVRAILGGRKTQTRRAINPQPSSSWHPFVGPYCPTLVGRDGYEYPGPETFGASDECDGRRCPYGAPGDRLWVRETWRPVLALSECEGPNDVSFAASADEAEFALETWRPSIYMPRWASRLTLEVKSVRVDRLREISEADALAEAPIFTEEAPNLGAEFPIAVSMFAHLWDSINAKRGLGWSVNPWVWVIEFEVLT